MNINCLSGVAEEFKAEDHVRITCRARWKSAHLNDVICTRNLSEDKTVAYRVKSDLVGLGL
jgi:hypothetical protein